MALDGIDAKTRKWADDTWLQGGAGEDENVKDENVGDEAEDENEGKKGDWKCESEEGIVIRHVGVGSIILTHKKNGHIIRHSKSKYRSEVQDAERT